MSLNLVPKEWGLTQEDKSFWEQELTGIHMRDNNFWIRFTHFNQSGHPVFEMYTYDVDDDDQKGYLRQGIKEQGHNHFVPELGYVDTNHIGFMNEKGDHFWFNCNENHIEFLKNYFQYLMFMTEQNREGVNLEID